MLDQLVESRNTSSENKRRSGFLLTTFVLVTAIALSGLLWSLFAKELGMGDESLELSTLVAPVPVPEEEPPPEPEEPEPEKEQAKEKPDTNISTRKDNILRLDESPKAPATTSVTKNTAKARPKGAFRLGDEDVTVRSAPSSAPRAVSGDGGGSIVSSPPREVEEEKPAAPPPPPPPPPKPTPPPVPKKISKGVVNGSAVSLPVPPYPAAARAVRASGAVNVQVEINESGSVTSASAVSGHPLLRRAAEQAARRARFRPTLLSGQAVKVSGVIVYNFKP
jgi:protein TonB